ncbi:hypothetical protein Tco_0861435, partial [Tanacetum coccineum]
MSTGRPQQDQTSATWKFVNSVSTGKKKDSNSEISVVNKAGKREQKRGIGNDIEDEEVIELNNASGVIDTSIGLMGIRLMDCRFNENGKLCGNIMKCVKECLIEIEPVTLGVGGLELRD